MLIGSVLINAYMKILNRAERCSYCNTILDYSDSDIREYSGKYWLCFGCNERMTQFIDEQMYRLVDLYINPDKKRCSNCDSHEERTERLMKVLGELLSPLEIEMINKE